MSDRFNVRIQVELNKLAPDGRGWTGERMSINETVELGAKDWSEVCQILGQFHELAEKLEKDPR